MSRADSVPLAVTRVVPQEQLLERRRLADQAADARRGERLEQPVELVGVDFAPHPVAVNLQAMHARQAVKPFGWPGQLCIDRGPGQVAQVSQRAGLDGAT